MSENRVIIALLAAAVILLAILVSRGPARPPAPAGPSAGALAPSGGGGPSIAFGPSPGVRPPGGATESPRVKGATAAAPPRRITPETPPTVYTGGTTPGGPSDLEGAPEAEEVLKVKEVKRPLATPRNDLAGLRNFAEIAPGVYRGAQPDSQGFKTLKEMGVKTVVNLRKFSSDRDDMKGAGLDYLHITFAPWHVEEEEVVQFLKVVTDPERKPVFVHCQHGADRTGTMIAIYRTYEEGWTMDEAMQELPRFGFHKIWVNLKGYLEGLDVEPLRKKVAEAESPKVERVE